MLTDGSAKVCIEQAHLPAGTTWGDIGDHMGTIWGPHGVSLGWFVAPIAGGHTYNGVHYGILTMESKGGPPTVSKVETFPEVNFSMLENLQICVANLGLFWTVSHATAPERTEMRKTGLTRGTMHMREDARGAAAREAGLKARLPR